MDPNNKPTLKKIVAQTNVEFVKEFRNWIPLLGTCMGLALSVAALVLFFGISTLLGFAMIPIFVLVNFWSIRFFNNIKYYWRP